MVPPQVLRLPLKSRKPLRKRRRPTLTITPISYRSWNEVYDCNRDLVLVFEDEEDPLEEHHTPPPSPTPSLIEECHLVEIMEGLYIALADDKADIPALRTFDDKPFTHVVQISYATPRGKNPLSLSNWKRKEAPRDALVQRLRLICPALSLRLCDEQTAVGPKELLAARDFLSLVLPHGSTKWWPEALRKDGRGKQNEQDERSARDAPEAQDDYKDEDDTAQFVTLAPDYGLDDWLDQRNDRADQDDDVNVLIVAPTSRAVDVLSVLYCYLAFLEVITPEDLVDMDYRDDVWGRVALGQWSMFYVELIARCD